MGADPGVHRPRRVGHGSDVPAAVPKGRVALLRIGRPVRRRRWWWWGYW